MILQALKEYYDRKVADPEAQMAPAGWEWKEIPFIVVLDHEGHAVGLECTYEGTGRQLRAKRFLVPMPVKRTVGVAANLLWDNPEYALGIDLKGRPDRVIEQHAAFQKRLEELGDVASPGVMAVRRFLALDDKRSALEAFGETLAQLLDSGANVSFRLAGETSLIVEEPLVRDALERLNAQGQVENGRCLVTGTIVSLERLHTAIKGVWGAQPTGANIVSFNLDAFRSFGKEQGANAPVGKPAAFAYTTALNHLLGKESKQRMQVGDTSAVFWSERRSDLEEMMGDFFSEPPKDDPDRNTRAVQSLYRSIETGTLSLQPDSTRFYVLGLAPNASRLAIRFWVVDSISGMAGKIIQHFRDMEIVHGPREQDALSLFRLLVSTAALGKAENIPPNLAGDTMRAVLEGLPYPRTLLQAAVRRIRAEHDVTYARAALIKACLNRLTRSADATKERELAVALDESNTNIGYRLGRLFATLEKIQGEANPGINATIRDRFYGGASGTPVAVFPNLMRLKNHHLAKLESEGRRIYFERLIARIMEHVTDFPPHLSLDDQGRFAIGYYHQVQDFYTRKSDKNDKIEQA